MLTVVFVCMATLSAYGRPMYSGYIDSPTMTAGQWWSGFDANSITVVSAHHSGSVSNNEVGLYFYKPDYGMSTGFSRVKNRVVSIQLKEDDPGENANETIRTYMGYFDIDEYGRYVPVRFANTGSSSDIVEDNTRLELYVRIKVNTYYKDFDDRVLGGIMCYRYWVDS